MKGDFNKLVVENSMILLNIVEGTSLLCLPIEIRPQVMLVMPKISGDAVDEIMGSSSSRTSSLLVPNFNKYKRLKFWSRNRKFYRVRMCGKFFKTRKLKLNHF